MELILHLFTLLIGVVRYFILSDRHLQTLRHMKNGLGRNYNLIHGLETW